MSPHAEAYILGACCALDSQLILLPRTCELITQATWDRMIRALQKRGNQ